MENYLSENYNPWKSNGKTEHTWKREKINHHYKIIRKKRPIEKKRKKENRNRRKMKIEKKVQKMKIEKRENWKWKKWKRGIPRVMKNNTWKNEKGKMKIEKGKCKLKREKK